MHGKNRQLGFKTVSILPEPDKRVFRACIGCFSNDRVKSSIATATATG